jgi:diaminohydroxyphosphoribosylaminopyrimidine deaminase/5-amino-6-(5-phosphoribosylamino)uracil reductase
VSKTFSSADEEHMRAALALAGDGLGQVAPNPSVGCIITDRHGTVVGRGATRPGGRPHAETEALAMAGGRAGHGTAYVTLEPCSHHGKTPPCCDALIAAGIARVVIACEDPDPRVNGKGIAALRAAGITVETGLLEAEALELNEGFILKVERGRPLVTLKMATSLDARIATHTGQSKWITGPAAREATHRMRAASDAIMVGVNTVLADDPELTCRIPGMEERSPLRIIIDSRLRLPLTARVVVGARDVPTWIVCAAGGQNKDRMAVIEQQGIELIEIASDDSGLPEIATVLSELGRRGITRLMVEGGSHLFASLLRADLVDRIVWYRAPIIIGGDGLPVFQALGVDSLDLAPRFERRHVEAVGEDLVETYYRSQR